MWKTLLLFCAALCLSALVAKADVGTSYDLTRKRDALMVRIDRIEIADSSLQADSATVLLKLYRQLAHVDAALSTSLRETIAREQQAKAVGRQGKDDLIFWAILLCVAVTVLIASHRISLQLAPASARTSIMAMYIATGRMFIGQITPHVPLHFRINPVVMIGLICMAISVLAMLLTSF